jgi:hypothetical protein
VGGEEKRKAERSQDWALSAEDGVAEGGRVEVEKVRGSE